MILACHNIKKAFGEEVIVSGGSFHIEDHEKAALVGPNGAGKTTLLKMIVGEIQADGGNVVLTRGKTMGYLAQHQDMNNDPTIYQEVRTAKADILDMERQIREIEQEMKHLTIVLNLRVVHLQKFSLVKTIQWMNLTAMLNLQLKNY